LQLADNEAQFSDLSRVNIENLLTFWLSLATLDNDPPLSSSWPNSTDSSPPLLLPKTRRRSSRRICYICDAVDDNGCIRQFRVPQDAQVVFEYLMGEDLLRRGL
jgi:hypothetical protein